MIQEISEDKFEISFNYTVDEDDSEYMKTTREVEEKRVYLNTTLVLAINSFVADPEIYLNDQIKKELLELEIEFPKEKGEFKTEHLSENEGKNWHSTTYRLTITIKKE
jgi:hypothetical protein